MLVISGEEGYIDFRIGECVCVCVCVCVCSVCSVDGFKSISTSDYYYYYYYYY